MDASLAALGATLGISDWITLVISTLVFLMLPGPGTFAVLTAAARGGLAAGFAALAGLMVGDLALMAMAAGGVAALLAAHPHAFQAVRYAGVVYLLWIGARLLHAGRRTTSGVPEPHDAENRGSIAGVDPDSNAHLQSGADSGGPAVMASSARQEDVRAAFVTGLLVTLLNPKAIVFYMAFFPLFVDPARHRGALTFAALAATISLLTLGYGTLLVVAGNTLARRLAARRRAASVARRAAGLVLVAFGVKLAVG